ncbi:MAG: HPF/RaiA family ribosome-associated protein [bacterium]
MERPLHLSTHGTELSDSAKSLIEDEAKRLERFYPRLVGCSVIVQGPGSRHRTGGTFSVHIDMRVPDHDPIVVNRQTAPDLDSAIRRSFDAAQRRLEDFARIQRGQVKRHDVSP